MVDLFATGRRAEVRRRPGPMEILKVPLNIEALCGLLLATDQAQHAPLGGGLGIFGNKLEQLEF